MRDPLWGFLILGIAIYALSGLWPDNSAQHIEVSAADIARIQDQWALQMRRAPTAQELSGLVDQFIKEEIYYREALALGLDDNDTIVRRRMVQKMTFLTEDAATAEDPDEQVLREFYATNAALYQLPRRYSFKHRYFSKDRREHAQEDAAEALSDSSVSGDPFMLQSEYALRSSREIADLFGSAFADALSQLEAATAWQGPLASAFGWHAVMLTRVTPEELPAYETLRERVLQDWRQQARQQANQTYYQNLRAQYEVSVAEPE